MRSLSKKQIIIAASAAAAVIIAVIIAVILTRPKSYRVLKSFEMTGTSSVERKNIGHLDVFVGMNFENEDVISTDEESSLRLALDSDKYVLLDELTVMELVAAGNKADSRTVLKLREGNILNEITTPLSENSSYVVNAPKSTMAVRGTSFNVNVKQLEDGGYITDVDVIHGHVDVQLLDENGEPTLFTYDTENTPVYPSDYLMLPEIVKETIINSNNSGLLVLNEEIAEKIQEETDTAEAEPLPAETGSPANVPEDNSPAEVTSVPAIEDPQPAETAVTSAPEQEIVPVAASEETVITTEPPVTSAEETSEAVTTTVPEITEEMPVTTTVPEVTEEIPVTTTIPETTAVTTAAEIEPDIFITTATTPRPSAPSYVPSPPTTTASSAATAAPAPSGAGERQQGLPPKLPRSLTSLIPKHIP